MKFNSSISKVLTTGAVLSAVTLGAFGFGGAASADGPNGYVPNLPPAPPVVQPVPFSPVWYARYSQPHVVNGRWLYPYAGYVNAVPFLSSYVYPVYAPHVVTASQFSFITSTANVLGMNRGDVVVKLQQGNTLTSIAAERGVQRVTLYNAVVSTMRGSINVAVSSGAVSPVTGNVLQANLNNRAGAVIDQPGTSSGTNAAAIETAYQLF